MLAGVKLVNKGRTRRTLTVSAQDLEGLLVSFLSEIVYFAEKDHLAFDDIDLEIVIDDDRIHHLSATLLGADIMTIQKTIKAVTYNDLHIIRSPQGFNVDIVFDV